MGFERIFSEARYCTVGNILALHATGHDIVPGIMYVSPQAETGVFPERRSSSKL